MKLGIMQPYFFPYIGYWQLINIVDKYVIYDDVNFITRGWINKNAILINNERHPINLKVQKASQNKLINEIELFKDDLYSQKLLKTLKSVYCKAPYYNDTFPLLQDIILQKETSLAKYLTYSIRQICSHLKIDTQILISSEIEKDNSLKGQNKIISICKILGADTYINAIGGIDLYSKRAFTQQGISLMFLKSKDIYYKQFKNEFVENLSIIDVMMFKSVDEIQFLLNEYEICEAETERGDL